MSLIKDTIKSEITRLGYSMTDAINIYNEKYAKKEYLQNFSKKLTLETVKHKEIVQLFDALGYELKWVKKE